MIFNKIPRFEFESILIPGASSKEYYHASEQATAIRFIKENLDLEVKLLSLNLPIEYIKISSIVDYRLIKIYANVDDETLNLLTEDEKSLVVLNSKDQYFTSLKLDVFQDNLNDNGFY
jgi:hypothetical protein